MSPKKNNIIKDNPLRILGVYSDCPMKEIIANLGKLRAFVKTGKMLDFDSDFTNLLGPVNRSVEAIEKAFNEIALPKDKLQAGLFWFMRHSDNDKAAMECLKVGAPNDAMAIIRRKGNYSSVINMAVLALALKRWDVALYSYSFLLESEVRRNALIKSFTDAEGSFTEEDLVEYISNKLFQEFPEAHWVEQIQKESVELGEKTYTFKSRFENSLLLKRLENLCVSDFKKSIESVLKQASAVSKDDAEANLEMAEQVEDKCKYVLKDLRRILGREDKEYIKIADRVANQILENCIYYYNHSADNPRRAQNVIKYTRFAYRTAESKTAKERAKSNLDYLNDALEKQMPESIVEEFNAIDKMVMNYHAMVKKTDCSELLIHIVEEVYKIVRSIKDKVGVGNKHYMDITSNFVQFVVQEIKIKRNKTSQFRSFVEKERYVSTLHWGRQLLDMLAKFDMDDDCKKNYDDEFSKVINGLAIVKPVKPFSQTFNSASKPKSNTSSQTRCTSVNNNAYSYHEVGVSSQKSGGSNATIIWVFVIVMGAAALFFADHLGRKHDGIQSTKNATSVETSANSEDSTPLIYDNSVTSDVVADENQTSSASSSDNSYQEETFRTIVYNTGDRPYKSTYGKGNYDGESLNSLKIKNGSDTDAVVFLERLNGKKVRHVFIGKGDNFTMTQIPGGKYIIKVMQGNVWNADKDNGEGNPKGGFMYSCSMSKSESYDPFDYPYPSSGQYSQGEVTLYKVSNGNMQTESINENELF